MIGHRVTALLVLPALMSNAPPPAPVQRAAPRAQASPVRCRVTPPNGDMVVASGVKRSARPFGIAAPPPPPPPPPPAVMPPPPVVVTSVPTPPPVFVPSPVAPVPAPPRVSTEVAYGTPGNTERYDGRPVATIQDTATAPVSTFSVDVDTGSYANVRRFLTEGQAVPPEAVRTEELLNYFRYDYPRPADRATPFSITADAAVTPWNPATRLIRVGLRAYDAPSATRPPANLVFLVDTSGSMDAPDKLPLVKAALSGLAGRLRPDDRVSIVAYAGSAGIVLEPTARKEYVDAALACLDAGGSTAGGQGIALAYATARAAFRPGAVNRIVLATDGDFNVGISDNKALEELVKRNRDDGITLTTLGFGRGNYNEAMMERIADVGNGNYAYIDSAMEAQKVLGDEMSATLVTVAKDVKIQVEFDPARVSQYRLIGYENRALAEQDFANDAVDAGDMGAGHQVTALYEVVPAGSPGWTPARRYPANRPAAPPARRRSADGGEACFVKLRYKLPDGTVSREVSRAVPAAMLADAGAPTGDMAFAAAVAAYGQKLRGDAYLGRFGFADVRRLAGAPRDYWRQEFVKLAALAEAGRGGGSGGE